MPNIVKLETKTEAKNQMMIVDKVLGDIITKMQDLEDEAKELNAKLRQTKEAQRLKEISTLKRQLTIERYEAIGQRKLIFRFLKRLGIEPPETKLTKLALKDEQVRALVEAHQ